MMSCVGLLGSCIILRVTVKSNFLLGLDSKAMCLEEDLVRLAAAFLGWFLSPDFFQGDGVCWVVFSACDPPSAQPRVCS